MASKSGGVKIVHVKLLGGWYIVRGPHNTPIGGRFASKEAAQAHLRRKNPAKRRSVRGKVVERRRKLKPLRRKKNTRRKNPVTTERGAVQQLIRFLKEKGFALVAANDGEKSFKNPNEKAALDTVFSVDESWLYFQREGFKRHYVYIVLGNAPDEVVSDHSYTEGDPDGFSKVMDEFIEKLSS